MHGVSCSLFEEFDTVLREKIYVRLLCLTENWKTAYFDETKKWKNVEASILYKNKKRWIWHRRRLLLCFVFVCVLFCFYLHSLNQQMRKSRFTCWWQRTHSVCDGKFWHTGDSICGAGTRESCSCSGRPVSKWFSTSTGYENHVNEFIYICSSDCTFCWSGCDASTTMRRPFWCWFQSFKHEDLSVHCVELQKCIRYKCVQWCERCDLHSLLQIDRCEACPSYSDEKVLEINALEHILQCTHFFPRSFVRTNADAQEFAWWAAVERRNNYTHDPRDACNSSFSFWYDSQKRTDANCEQKYRPEERKTWRKCGDNIFRGSDFLAFKAAENVKILQHSQKCVFWTTRTTNFGNRDNFSRGSSSMGLFLGSGSTTKKKVILFVWRTESSGFSSKSQDILKRCDTLLFPI